MTRIHTIVEQALVDFVLRFIEYPYDAYTEHGQHALFLAELRDRLSPNERFTSWQGRRVSVLQKEYPTADRIGKPKRQHWDVAVLKTPTESVKNGYDYLRLDSVVEFGMNEAVRHLADDIQRLTHRDAYVDHRFVVHLYRLSTPGAMFSGRDMSPKSKRLANIDEVERLTVDNDVIAYYAIVDQTRTHKTAAYRAQHGHRVNI